MIQAAEIHKRVCPKCDMIKKSNNKRFCCDWVIETQPNEMNKQVSLIRKCFQKPWSITEEKL